MEKKKVAILFGGCPTEYEVSLPSFYAVISHVDREQYHVVERPETEADGVIKK